MESLPKSVGKMGKDECSLLLKQALAQKLAQSGLAEYVSCVVLTSLSFVVLYNIKAKRKNGIYS